MKISVSGLPILLLLLHQPGFAQERGSSSTETNDPIERIRDEGMNHSQVMETLSTLTEVIGPRLTGSPNLKHANEWTRDQLQKFGLSNAHLEAWGPFGRGWSLKRFSASVVEPQQISLIGYPNAWSPGLSQPLVTDVVYFEGGTNDMEKLKGRLEGKIVLNGPTREVRPRFDAFATRLAETNLLRLANSAPGRSGDFMLAGDSGRFSGGFGTRGGATNRFAGGPRGERDDSESSTNAARTGPGGRGGFRGRPGAMGRSLSFLANEKAA